LSFRHKRNETKVSVVQSKKAQAFRAEFAAASYWFHPPQGEGNVGRKARIYRARSERIHRETEGGAAPFLTRVSEILRSKNRTNRGQKGVGRSPESTDFRARRERSERRGAKPISQGSPKGETKKLSLGQGKRHGFIVPNCRRLRRFHPPQGDGKGGL